MMNIMKAHFNRTYMGNFMHSNERPILLLRVTFLTIPISYILFTIKKKNKTYTEIYMLSKH